MEMVQASHAREKQHPEANVPSPLQPPVHAALRYNSVATTLENAFRGRRRVLGIHDTIVNGEARVLVPVLLALRHMKLHVCPDASG
jgi:hypothetical protein